MSEWYSNDQISQIFELDYGQSTDLVVSERHGLTVLDSTSIHKVISSVDVMGYQDPLKHVYKFQFKPLQIDLGQVHFVEPHYVKSYIRSDGTFVEGYYRDGDGNTNVNRTVAQGGGYIRTNPDGNPFNNLNNV